MAHENLKPLLVGKPGKSFVIDLTKRVYEKKVVNISRSTGNYDFINYRFFIFCNIISMFFNISCCLLERN